MAVLDETKESLGRVQNFDAKSLPRRNELGAKFAFDEAVEPANRVIALFQKIPLDALDEFPDPQLTIIKKQADQVFNQFDQILQFDETAPDATAKRQSLIDALSNSYQNAFAQLFPFISFSVARTVDFNRLEEQGRAAVQAISDQTNKIVEELNQAKEDAKTTLDEVRTAAAEQGVSQQATYFKSEADKEEKLAAKWQMFTLRWAGALAVYGIASLFLHKWSFLAPLTVADGIALTASKLIIFAVLLFMLFLSSKTFLSHKHNATVNRHRQNGLQTFQTLVNAGTTDATQDIILSHASASIFAPQETGFTKQNSQSSPNTVGMVDLAVRAASRSATSSQ